MSRSSGKARRVLITMSFAILVSCPVAGALRNYENHPDLAIAMEHDAETNGGDMEEADREIATLHYLKYLEDANDSFQIARVYCQLGAMHAVSFNKQKGESRDRAKAREYYRKVLEFEPKRIGRPTIVARNMLSTLENSGGIERVKARMKMYKWLAGIDKDEVKTNWVPLGPAPIREVRDPNLVETREEKRRRRRKAMMGGLDLSKASEGTAIGLGGLVSALKENAVYNASYDAIASENPGAAFDIILESLDPNAPERKVVLRIMQERADGITSMRRKSGGDSGVVSGTKAWEEKAVVDANGAVVPNEYDACPNTPVGGGNAKYEARSEARN